jgi:hypothetical protein
MTDISDEVAALERDEFAEASMPDIKQVTVITRNPNGAKGDLGSCEIGFYTLSEDGLLTMTDGQGGPLRDENTGHKIEMHLLPGENEKAAAKKLTLKIYRDAPDNEMAGFHRPIRYPRSWLA